MLVLQVTMCRISYYSIRVYTVQTMTKKGYFVSWRRRKWNSKLVSSTLSIADIIELRRKSLRKIYWHNNLLRHLGKLWRILPVFKLDDIMFDKIMTCIKKSILCLCVVQLHPSLLVRSTVQLIHVGTNDVNGHAEPTGNPLSVNLSDLFVDEWEEKLYEYNRIKVKLRPLHVCTCTYMYCTTY